MNRDVLISALQIQEIREDGSTVSSDAYFFNPMKVVWMKQRVVANDWKRPYTIIKLEDTEPFMAEGSIEQYIGAMGMKTHEIFGWDFEDDEDDFEEAEE